MHLLMHLLIFNHLFVKYLQRKLQFLLAMLIRFNTTVFNTLDTLFNTTEKSYKELPSFTHFKLLFVILCLHRTYEFTNLSEVK